jgi:hypothetical protein
MESPSSIGSAAAAASRVAVRGLLQQLCAGEGVDGGSILSAVARLRDGRARAELTGAAREHAPSLSMRKPSFLILVDLFRVCLREANNAGDYKCVRNIFNLAYQFGMELSGGAIFVGRMLQSHEAWKNINFWLFCADELIRYDIMRFTYWTQRNSPVLPLEEPIFIATVVIIRLQAIVFNSMQVVRVPAEVVLDFLNTAAEIYGISGSETGYSAGADLLRRPVSDFVAWLQDTIIFEMRSDLAPYIKDDSARGEGGESAGDEASVTSSTATAPATGGDKAPSAEAVGALSYDMGFCPLLELLYRLVVKHANASPAMANEGDSSHIGSSYSSGAIGQSAARRQAPGPMISCVCGQPTGRWRVLGTFPVHKKALASSMLSRRLIRHVLCETCFRRMTQTDCAPAPIQSVVAMGACAVPTNWPGNLPNNFLAIFYGSGLSDYRLGAAANINEDSLRASFSRRIRDTLLDRSESGPARLLSSSAVVKLLATEGKELTSIGIGGSGSGIPHTSSLSYIEAGMARSGSVSSRHSSMDQDGPSLRASGSERPGGGRRKSVLLAKDSLHIQRERGMAESQLQGFIAAMQSGVDVLKFGHNPIHPLQMRTFFIDKEVSRLCWLTPGR